MLVWIKDNEMKVNEIGDYIESIKIKRLRRELKNKIKINELLFSSFAIVSHKLANTNH